MQRKINNPGLGMCHILKENTYGYLIYIEENTEHFLITGEITENGSFHFNGYFKDLDESLEVFNKLGESLNE